MHCYQCFSSDDCDSLFHLLLISFTSASNIILLQGNEIQQLLQPLLRTSSLLQTVCVPPKVTMLLIIMYTETLDGFFYTG